MINNNNIARVFLLTLLVGVLFFCFLVFKPFLIEIIAAAILVSIFYTPYEWLVKKLKGRKKTSALLMCILVALLVIIPMTNFLVYTAQRSVVAYDNLQVYIADIGSGKSSQQINTIYLKVYDYIVNNTWLKNAILQSADIAKDWLATGAANIIAGTAGFIFSLVLIIFTMFFFFIDGERMVKNLMYWTPLPNQYDKEIFKKFRDVSYSTVMSTFVTAIAQGMIGGVGLMIVGVPAFFASIAMAFLSLLPYFGAALVWFPIAIYLLVTTSIWKGLVLLAWGSLIVSWTDNLLRAYLIKTKAQVHPIFVIFSILGGITLFGFWGVIFGPLIISLAVTVLHIFEMEYGHVLEK